MFKRVLGLLVVVVVCASCITGVKAGKRCNTSEWGDDGTYALKCENGRWVRKATKAQVAQLLIAIAKAKATPPAPDLPLAIAADGRVTRKSAVGGPGEQAISVDEAGGWYGLVFHYQAVFDQHYVGVLAHVTAGPNGYMDYATQLIDSTGTPFRVIPAGDGSRAALVGNSGRPLYWTPAGGLVPADGPFFEGVACVSGTHFFSVLENSHEGAIDNTVLHVEGDRRSIPVDCSANGRFISVVVPGDGTTTIDDGGIYDVATGSFTPVVSGVDVDDSVALTRATDDGSYIGVARESDALIGVWSRSTGSVRSLLGAQSDDVPFRVSPDGARVLGLRPASGGAQLVQFGPRASYLLGTPFPSGTDFAFSPDLQSGMRLDTDGSLRIIHPDWSGPG